MTTEAQLNLAELRPGARVEIPLLVVEIQARGGDTPHTVLVLANAAGQIPSAPFWASEPARLDGVTTGTVLLVSGTVSCYRRRPQLSVERFRIVPPRQVDWDALLPSIGDRAPWWATLERWRTQIRSPRLTAILDLFFTDAEFRSAFGDCPASTAGHHARLGGLLLHTVEVGRIALAMADLHTDTLDRDLLLTGALLHDIGKINAYQWGGGFRVTVAGMAIGHVVLGVRMLEQRLAGNAPPRLTEEERLLLLHLMLSHHGRLEFGAPVVPMTLEAELLHLADNASARAASMADALASNDLFGGEPITLRPVWTLDRRRAWRGQSEWGRPERETAAGHGGPAAVSHAAPWSGWPSSPVLQRERCESDRVADQSLAEHPEALHRGG
jgi:3'-5' exoribonuclease